MQIEPEIDGVSVVVIGNFNPALFTPAWFALYDLLPQRAVANANLEVAHPEITRFQTDWLTLQVTADRFAPKPCWLPISGCAIWSCACSRNTCIIRP